MTTIYLVRHGEVAGNSGERRTMAGWQDLPLTDRGRAQAQAVANFLKLVPLDTVITSPLQRAFCTAQAIAGAHSLVPQLDDGWKEVNYGKWEGKSEEEISIETPLLWQRRVKDPWTVAPPEGESYEQLWHRLAPAWQQLISTNSHRQVAVVAHNGPLRVLLCYLLEAPLRNARRIVIGNCSVSKIELTPDETGLAPSPTGKIVTAPVVIAYVNNTCHLKGI